MSVEMQALEDAVRVFQSDADLDFVDPRRLANLIDSMQGTLCAVLHRARKRHQHQLTSQSACSWAARQCQTSRSAAADRLCVGEQLESMPRLAAALRAGEVGFQATAAICHLQERVGAIGARIDEGMWIDNALRFSIKDLRDISARTWHAVDPAGFDGKVEDDHERRQLFLSETDGMYRLDGWLTLEGGAAVKSVVDSLSRPLGADDTRSPKQRRHDGLVEAMHHALGAGTLPRRNGVRPHITITTTVEGLKRELGAPASELEGGLPISSKTVQRLACDGALHRILKSGSVVVDVGRVTRAVSVSQWRALKARHRTCAFPGCDRPVNMTSPHHIEFWAHGGRSDIRNLLPLCYVHHRLVHEGEWHVIRAGDKVEFIPPDRPVMIRRRWGEGRWAA